MLKNLCNDNCSGRTREKTQPVFREDLHPAHFSTLNFSFNSYLAIIRSADLDHAEGKDSP